MKNVCSIIETKDFGRGQTHISIKCLKVGQKKAGYVDATVSSKCEIRHYSASPKGRGYGRMALPLVHGYMKEHLGCSRVFLLALTRVPQEFWQAVGYHAAEDQDDVEGLIAAIRRENDNVLGQEYAVGSLLADVRDGAVFYLDL